MTMDDLAQVVERARARRSGIKQTAEEIGQLLALWQWPPLVVPDHQNLVTIIENCLVIEGHVEPRLLTRTYNSIRSQLRHYVPPQTAPVIEEPVTPAPVPKTQDALGAATSTEVGIEHHQQSAPEPSTPIADAAASLGLIHYEHGEYKAKLDAMWRESRAQSIENGHINHARAQALFNARRAALDAEIAAAQKRIKDQKQSMSMDALIDAAVKDAIAAGAGSNQKEFLRRVNEYIATHS